MKTMKFEQVLWCNQYDLPSVRGTNLPGCPVNVGVLCNQEAKITVVVAEAPVLRQTVKVGFASAEDLDVTEGPVRNSGPYGFRSRPAVLALTTHQEGG